MYALCSLGLGLVKPSRGFRDNTCLTQVGNSGTLYGTVGTYVIEPTHNVYGQLIYLSVDTSNDEVIVKLGDAGNEQLPEPASIILIVGGDAVTLVWDETNLYYSGTSAEVTTSISGATDICFGLYGVPDLLIHYTFSEVER